jgi:MoxR-like ATPase
MGLVAGLLVAGSATGLVMKVSHDNEVTNQRVAAAAAQKRTADAAKASADAAAAAVAVKQAADDTTRTERKDAVTEMEASILKDAKARVRAQELTGPILSASCTPLGGGSADDLTALTGTFECIAVNKKNADGSSQGYRFASTINWNEGSYSWHLGS